MINRTLLLLSVLLFSIVALAQPGKITFSLKQNATLFWIHNKSKQIVFLDRDIKKDPGAQAGWGSIINPGRWSILSLSKANAKGQPVTQFSCFSDSGRKMPAGRLNCDQVVKAGVVEGTRLPENFQTGFWFAENKTLLGLRKQFQYWKVPYPYLYFFYLKLKAL